jgi:dTDP-4-amino-4,6-dideoxygalactose transaminase
LLKLENQAWPIFGEDEIRASGRVLRSGKVNQWSGTEVRLFEEEFAQYCDVKYAIALANGTVALELALKALNVGAGDEVIVPSWTFIATASAVVACGATPIVADVGLDSLNIAPDSMRSLVTSKTKAIIAVHLVGRPCDMATILKVAEAHSLKVIEDCAQAHGAEYGGRKVGSMGHIGTFSFCQDKIMTTGGEGGMLTTNDKALWRLAWSYKDHGKDYDAVFGPNESDQFRWVHHSFGTNWRMTEMQAAIGLVQLGKLDKWLVRRGENALVLEQKLLKLPLFEVLPAFLNGRHANYKFYAFINPNALASGWNRDRVILALRAEGVPCSTGICPEIYRERAFTDLGLGPSERLPNAMSMGERSILFLIDPTYSESDVVAIAYKIEKVSRVASAL